MSQLRRGCPQPLPCCSRSRAQEMRFAAGDDRDQPGLRRWRQLRRHADERLHRAVQPEGDAVDLTGWSVQYARAPGTTWQRTSLCRHDRSRAGTTSSRRLPAPAEPRRFRPRMRRHDPDERQRPARSRWSRTTRRDHGRDELPLARVVDLVGYGSGRTSSRARRRTDSCSNTTAALRDDWWRHRHRQQHPGLREPERRIRATAALSPPPPPPSLGACNDDLETRIHTIQGSGSASPVVGSIRVIEGVVVGDFQGSTSLSGYFVQEENADADSDPLSSEGIFVFDRRCSRSRRRRRRPRSRQRAPKFRTHRSSRMSTPLLSARAAPRSRRARSACRCRASRASSSSRGC